MSERGVVPEQGATRRRAGRTGALLLVGGLAIAATGYLLDRAREQPVLADPPQAAGSGSAPATASAAQPATDRAAARTDLCAVLVDVEDGTTRAPVSGALISGVRDSKGTALARTDQRGRALLNGLRRNQSIRLEVTAAGYQASTRTVALDSASVSLKFELRGTVTLSGTVTSDGGPVAGARIWVDAVELARTESDGSYRVDGLRARPRARVSVRRDGYRSKRRVTALRTDAVVDFVLSARPMIRLTLSLYSGDRPLTYSGSATAIIKSGPALVHNGSLRFEGGDAVLSVPDQGHDDLEVTGTLGAAKMRGGGPLSRPQAKERGFSHIVRLTVGDTVELVLSRGGAAVRDATAYLRTETGVYTFDTDGRGTASVPVDLPCRCRIWQRRAGVSRELELRAAGPLHVALGDFGGRLRVVGDETRHIDVRGQRGELRLPEPEDGLFLVPPGRYRVLRRGSPVASIFHEVRQGEETVVRLDLPVALSSILGTAPAGATVELHPLDRFAPTGGRRAVADAEGRFAFQRLEAGAYLVEASTGRCTRACAEVEIGAGEAREVSLERTDHNAVELEFVSSTTGRPVPNLPFDYAVLVRGTELFDSCSTDRTGRARISRSSPERSEQIVISLPEGFALVRVAAGARRERVRIPDWPQDIELVIRSGLGRIRGLFAVHSAPDSLWFRVPRRAGDSRYRIGRSPAGALPFVAIATENEGKLLRDVTVVDGRAHVVEAPSLGSRLGRLASIDGYDVSHFDWKTPCDADHRIASPPAGHVILLQQE